ncbi:MAG: hypothetical protein IJY61_02380 [Candidatus Gastranaerophilales bacterium]|nr:hypothetical protein [Candidatus Gastranaerophilales bacterium]
MDIFKDNQEKIVAISKKIEQEQMLHEYLKRALEIYKQDEENRHDRQIKELETKKQQVEKVIASFKKDNKNENLILNRLKRVIKEAIE